MCIIRVAIIIYAHQGIQLIREMALRRNTYNSRALAGNLIRPPGDGRSSQECVFRLRFLILYPRAAEFFYLLFPSRHFSSPHLHMRYS